MKTKLLIGWQVVHFLSLVVIGYDRGDLMFRGKTAYLPGVHPLLWGSE